METTRRELVGAAAAGAALSLLPRSLHEAMAQPMRPGGLKAIEHVIVLMQENRSFDHYYGTMRGVRGFGDRVPLALRNGRPVFAQPAGTGEVLPFSLREAAARAGRPGTDIQYLGDLDHSFNGSTSAWGQGWNDNWIAAKTAATMTYYERRDIPLQYELAETFTFCDAYHCSVFGSTNPNRNYLVSGTTGAEPGTGLRAVTNAAYSYDHPGYGWTTYAERLEAAGISWQVYQEWDNFTDNAIEYFVPFKRVGTKMLAAVEERFRTTEEFYDKLHGRAPADQQRLLAQLQQGRDTLLNPAEQRLFDRGMHRSEPESLVPRLKADMKAGRLPAVSWLVPSSVDSEHPGASTPVGSANLMYDVLDALASDRETWSKTVLFINFDENDGYFDHVPPPVAPRPLTGESDDWTQGKPIGLAARVPMTVVSPWTVGGHVCSEVFDHTSVLQFLERWTGIEEPNISPWRRGVTGDLTSAFDFERQGRPPAVSKPAPVPAPIDRWHPTTPPDQRMPQVERGRKPLRALPYQPSTMVMLDRAGRLDVALRNDGPSAAHFAIYPYAGELLVPEHVDVLRRENRRLAVPGPSYKVAIQGPNRYWYEASGSKLGAAARLEVWPAKVAFRTVLALALANPTDKRLTVRVLALGYGTRAVAVKLKAGETKTLNWDTDDGWYDVEITVEEDRAFRRRITGRVENGRPGVTA